ncbi:ArsR/SmtB family transcription factor [Robiginitalea sediminis]|uniref:ArsR/SmtB family transcription factor n=1 Tax=Robiginitalea sediminis TaxID=1982593 RepID=UPI000B4BC033|nr:metalloregulator ArsR/SmtB family transcription factor [Robiginitalea sediminis]
MKKHTCIRQQADIDQINQCKAVISDLDETFSNISNVLEVIANGVRFRILFLLHQEQKLCVCDLSDILGMNISAISQHLRKLKDKELIASERQGQTIHYYLTNKHSMLLKSLLSKVDEEKIMTVL